MEVFQREHPDVVITDLIMPEQEGIETIAAIKRERPEVKIIAISGGGRIANTNLLQIARHLGADEILAKPFDAEELRRCLARTASVSNAKLAGQPHAGASVAAD